MGRITEKQIEKLLDDIATIKSVIKENRPIVNQLLLPAHFRVISFLSGFGIMGISLAYAYFLNRYGTYNAIPNVIQTLLIAAIAVLTVSVWILKSVLWFRSVHKMNKDLTFGQMIKHLYSDQILHIWISVGALMGFFVVYFYCTGHPHYIPIAVGIGTGIVYNLIGGMTRIWQYLLTGYWFLITSILPLVFSFMGPLIWLAISIGGGFVLFGFISTRPAESEIKE